MKFLITLSGIFFYCQLSLAQLDPVFGIQAGPTFRTGLISGEDSEDEKSSMLVGFGIGGVVEFALGDQKTLRSGLTFLSKGTKLTDEFDDYAKFSPLYLEIPVILLFNTTDFRFGLGPYFAFGIGGKTESNSGSSSDIEFGTTDDDDWSPSDVGLALQAYRTFDVVEVGLSIEYGFSDMVPKGYRDDGLEYHVHNLCFFLSAGYKFQ